MIKPLPGYVLIEPLEADEKTSSGFVIPDSAKDRPVKGTLLDIGQVEFPEGWVPSTSFDQQAMAIRDSVKKGQTVIYKKWSGQDVTEDGKDLKLVEFKDLIGVVE